MLAAILICGLSVFTSCSDDKDSEIDNLSEKIIGKWIFADRNGETTPTNNKRVFTFVSTTKAYVSASRNTETEHGVIWVEHSEADVAISGNKMTLTMQTDEHTTMVDEFDITAISDNEFTAHLKVTVMVNGIEERVTENNIRLTKVTADYSEAIVGTWQGRCTSTGSAFDDGQEHRWQYKADGTYVYYCKDANGQWEPKSANISQYFVDGSLLCTRWQNTGESENREWWEINIAAGKMNWTALRQADDGTTFTVTFEMTKVE